MKSLILLTTLLVSVSSFANISLSFFKHDHSMNIRDLDKYTIGSSIDAKITYSTTGIEAHCPAIKSISIQVRNAKNNTLIYNETKNHAELDQSPFSEILSQDGYLTKTFALFYIPITEQMKNKEYLIVAKGLCNWINLRDLPKAIISNRPSETVASLIKVVDELTEKEQVMLDEDNFVNGSSGSTKRLKKVFLRY